jgi:hypothetical protein
MITTASDGGFEHNDKAYYMPDYHNRKAAINMIKVFQTVKSTEYDIAGITVAS